MGFIQPYIAPLIRITFNSPCPFLSAFNGKYEDIHELITNLVVAFTFATAVVVVALPLFGYKLSLVTEVLGSPADENSLRTDPTAEAFTSYGAPPAYEGYARSLASSLVSRFSKTSTSHDSPNYPEMTSTHTDTQHSTTQQAYRQHLRVTPYFSVRKHSA